jgi:hypothetical protein
MRRKKSSGRTPRPPKAEKGWRKQYVTASWIAVGAGILGVTVSMGGLLLPLWATILLLGISIVLISVGMWNLLQRLRIAMRIALVGLIAVGLSYALYGPVKDRANIEKLSHWHGKLGRTTSVVITRAVIATDFSPRTITKENPYVTVMVAPPVLPDANQKEWWIIIEGIILNYQDEPIAIKAWSVDLHPLDESRVFIRNMSIPAGFLVKNSGEEGGMPFYVEDFWPSKMNMRTIPAGATSSGWMSAVLHVSTERLDIRGATLSLHCLDTNDKVHSASLVYKGPLGI